MNGYSTDTWRFLSSEIRVIWIFFRPIFCRRGSEDFSIFDNLLLFVSSSTTSPLVFCDEDSIVFQLQLTIFRILQSLSLSSLLSLFLSLSLVFSLSLFLSLFISLRRVFFMFKERSDAAAAECAFVYQNYVSNVH